MTLTLPRRISESGYDITPIPDEMKQALADGLEPLARTVACEAGTERAFTGSFWDTIEEGTYVCVVCGLPLFSSKTKFDSGCGWPSYFEPVDPEHTVHVVDDSLGMVRTEVRCARSGTHLGHVFDDGPAPTGQRFCINSASLVFVLQGQAIPSLQNPMPPEAASEPGIATFGAGCFWGVESTFRKVSGVTDAQVGYCGGAVANPSYEQVCGGNTGHAEAIEVKFDPHEVSYGELLEIFFSCHDPTQLNRQGPDVGSQYRSVVFYLNDAQQFAALAAIDQLQLSGRLPRPIATEVAEAAQFYRAEEYHQRYFEKSGGVGGCGIGGAI